ncbi:MAG TPA: acylphosphatase [Nocardioides sp.]|nr:acylphosphatase [Nocardioides sp.]
MRTSVDIRVTGRVQGVSFRYYAEREAARLGVAGWVRNEPDGSVAAHVEGDPSAVDAFVRWCHDGPSMAYVERVDARPADDQGLTSFGVR